MSRDVSDLFREAAYAQHTDQAVPVLLDIEHSLLAATLRYTNNFENITSNGNLYEARGFTITLPRESETSPGRAIVRIDNVDLAIVEQIRLIAPPPAKVTIQIVRASAPDVIELLAQDLELLDARYDVLIVEGDLSQENYDREPYPRDLMTTTS